MKADLATRPLGDVQTSAEPEAPSPPRAGGGGPLARGSVRSALLLLVPVWSFVLLFVLLSVTSDAFLDKDNLLNVLEANAPIGIVACTGTIVIVAGGLDVSVGAIFALSGVVGAKVVTETGSVPLGLLAGAGSGAALGLFNGLMVTVGRVDSFVATLAGAILFGSTAQVVAGGELLTPSEDGFDTLGRGDLMGVKYSIVLLALTALATGLTLARGRFGRRAVVAGANAEAARLSGVSVGRVQCLTFVLSGLSAAVAGLIVTSRSGQTDAAGGGTEMVLAVIAAIAIGGTSLRGGRGAIWRTIVGVLFLGLVTNGLGLLDVDPTYYQFVIGLLILAAVVLESIGERLERNRPRV